MAEHRHGSSHGQEAKLKRMEGHLRVAANKLASQGKLRGVNGSLEEAKNSFIFGIKSKFKKRHGISLKRRRAA